MSAICKRFEKDNRLLMSDSKDEKTFEEVGNCNERLVGIIYVLETHLALWSNNLLCENFYSDSGDDIICAHYMKFLHYHHLTVACYIMKFICSMQYKEN